MRRNDLRQNDFRQSDLTRRLDTHMHSELLDYSDDLQREQITQPSSPWSPSGFYCIYLIQIV